jgi:hypothetical protein
MDLYNQPLDVIKLILNYCDLLSILRLELVCKRFKNILNDKFWEDKIINSIYPYHSSCLPSFCNKIELIIREIKNIKYMVVDKYEHIFLILNQRSDYKGNHRELDSNEYRILYWRFQEYELILKIKKLYKYLHYRRKVVPLEKRKYISVVEETGYTTEEMKEEYKDAEYGTIIGVHLNHKILFQYKF